MTVHIVSLGPLLRVLVVLPEIELSESLSKHCEEPSVFGLLQA